MAVRCRAVGGSQMIYQYECGSCGEVYEHTEKGTHYCDWIDCENEQPLDYIGPVVEETK
jgi:hypothetical protein